MNVPEVNEAIKTITIGAYTWPGAVLVVGVVWAIMWCIKNS